MKVFQEFYCGECRGYILVKLNMSLNHVVEVVCPNCDHHHLRNIKDGQIFEQGRGTGAYKEEICPPKSAYSKESRVNTPPRRDGVKIEKPEDVNQRHPAAASMLNERWFEIYGGR